MTLRTVFMITGIGVHDPPESVFTIDWNLCSRSNGIRVHDPPESAAENGRRQLRAYVFPDQANLVWQGTAKPTLAEIGIKNSGQTPAYRLSTTTAVVVGDFPLQGDLHVPPMPDNHTVVPPNGSYSLTVTMGQPLTGDQLKGIQKGTQAIYAFGEIAYMDAFDDCRMTRYKFYYTGAGADIGSRISLTYLDEGNTEVPCPKTK
jgi:hypothetical protein